MASPSQSPPDDAVVGLIPAVLAGDAAAIDRWFRGEHSRVWRLCLGFLADPGEAEDVAQDAMLHLLDRLEAWDRSRPYRAWRNAVVLNLCRDRLRRLDARRRAHARAAEAHEEAAHGILPDPHDEAARAETLEVLRETLAALSPREREAFVLRDLEGCSTQETADQLGVTPSSVRSLLTLARRRLRGLLAERVPGLAPGGEHA
jgi:RNA polymerase sigma-70 factor (ECF subfamily)